MFIKSFRRFWSFLLFLFPVVTLAQSIAPTVAAGPEYTLSIHPNGTLWASGLNDVGQLGDGTTTNRATPVPIIPASTWVAVAAGVTHAAAIRADGTLWSWGSNSYGQLGDGTTSARSTPAQVGTNATWVKIAAGKEYTVAIRADGTLWAWGLNREGQLGDSTTTNRLVPIRIGTATNWAFVTTGYDHTIAGQTTGTLWGWGSNSNWQVGVSTIIARLLAPTRIGTASSWTEAAAGSDFTLAVQANGSLWGWGANFYGGIGAGNIIRQADTPLRIGTASNWKHVAAGFMHSLATRTDGTLWGTGRNDYGQVGDGTPEQRHSFVQIGTATNWEAIAAGRYHSAAQRSDGTLWGWGYNPYGQIGSDELTACTYQYFVVPLNISVVATPRRLANSLWASVTASSSSQHVLAIRTDSSFWGWGLNDANQSGDGVYGSWHVFPVQTAANRPWKSLAVGYQHSAGISRDGRLWMWGYNYYGLGDGTLLGKTAPAQLGSATNWKSVSAGVYHTVAVRTDGTLWAWGLNSTGQLGDGSTTNRLVPTRVGTATNWLTVSAGENYTVAIRADGTLWAWGSNGDYQLGDGTTTNRAIPVQIGTATTWRKVSAGSSHTTAIRSDSSLWTWGANDYGQCGNGSITAIPTPARVGMANDWLTVAAGRTHTVAVRTNGTLWGFGHNGYGQLGDPAIPSRTLLPLQLGTATDWRHVVAGARFTTALRVNGAIWSWGENTYGQLGTPTYTYHPVLVSRSNIVAAVKQSRSSRVWQDVYPNPAHDKVHVTATDNVPYRLLDLLGREQRSWPKKATTLDLQGIKSGVYLLQHGHTSMRLSIE